MNKKPTLYIITGPPGAGKLVHVYRTPHLRRLPIYCCYHLNKAGWYKGNRRDTVLLAYSPSHHAKSHWIKEALANDYTPVLMVVKTERGDSMRRMVCRPKNNSLQKEVNDWYLHYTPHPDESIIDAIPFDARSEKGIYKL